MKDPRTNHSTNRKRSRQLDEDDDFDDGPLTQCQLLSQPNNRLIHNHDSAHNSTLGTILRIHVRNFMCHDALEINLNPKINFIVGRNGSGKSAILMALIVGLGGRASSTSRGSALKEFVKKGKQTAVIKVTLNNFGPLGFKNQLYGDRITVVRTLSNGSGPTGYKIKSASGNTRSTKRSELGMLMAHLQIQVDNPVAVLNQDASRTFLHTSNPGDKYELFMRATQLDVIHEKHAQAQRTLIDAENALHFKNSVLGDVKKRVEKFQNLYLRLKTVPEQKRKIHALTNELRWARVLEMEHLQAKAEAKQAEEEAALLQLKQQAEHEADREIKLQQLFGQTQSQLSAFRESMTDLETRLAEANKKCRCSSQAHNTKRRHLQALQVKIQGHVAELTSLREAIDQRKQETGEDVLRRQEAARLNLAQLSKCRSAVGSCAQQCDRMRMVERTKREESNEAKAHIQKLNLQIQGINLRLKDMQRNSSSSLAVYGRDIPALVTAIDKAHGQGRFLVKPVGPLGAYMKVRDASWVPCLEQLVRSNFLCSFLVDNQRDKMELYQIFKRVFQNQMYQPDVLMGKFIRKMHDTSRHAAVSSQYTTALDAILFSEVVVANAAIDHLGLESTLLVPTGDDAVKITEKIGTVPRNCRRVLVKNGDTFFPAPEYKTYCGRARYRAKYLEVSMQDAIRTIQAELDSQTRDLTAAEATQHALSQELRALESEARGKQLEFDTLTRREQQLAAEMELMEVPEEHAITALSEDQAELEQKMEQMQQQKQTIEADVQMLSEQMERDKEAAAELVTEVQAGNTREHPLLASIHALRSDLRACVQTKSYVADRLHAQESSVVTAASNTAQCTRTAQDKAQEAMQLCPRVATERSTPEIVAEKSTLEASVAASERVNGSYLDVQRRYNEEKYKYDETEAQVKKLEQHVEYVHEEVEKRKEIYKKIQVKITRAFEVYFHHAVKQRRFTGKISVDHGAKSLHMEVCPEHRLNTTKDTCTLSGGERSYSTVMFLIALQHTIKMPFYFMDEFDVFMDKVNRRTILDRLLNHAQEQRDHQFVFLTPQDTASISMHEDITIHRMDDPQN